MSSDSDPRAALRDWQTLIDTERQWKLENGLETSITDMITLQQEYQMRFSSLSHWQDSMKDL